MSLKRPVPFAVMAQGKQGAARKVIKVQKTPHFEQENHPEPVNKQPEPIKNPMRNPKGYGTKQPEPINTSRKMPEGDQGFR